MQSRTQIISKILRQETKQSNENLFFHSILTQATSGEDEKALIPATEKAFSLMVDHIRELFTEKFG